MLWHKMVLSDILLDTWRNACITIVILIISINLIKGLSWGWLIYIMMISIMDLSHDLNQVNFFWQKIT